MLPINNRILVYSWRTYTRSCSCIGVATNRDEDLTLLPLLDYSRGYLRNEAALCLPRACTTPRTDILLFARRRTVVVHAKEAEGQRENSGFAFDRLSNFTDRGRERVSNRARN